MFKKGEDFGAPRKFGPFCPGLRCQLATAFQNCSFCAEQGQKYIADKNREH